MTDLRMGFKHTVYPSSKTLPISCAQPQPTQVTDFSINRILSESKDKSKKPATIRKVQNFQNTIGTSATPTPKNALISTRSTTATDILDLSKPCAERSTSHTPYRSAQNYHGLHQDILTAAAAANATKLYVQFFPHMFPTYATAAHLNVSGISPYQQKRYFAPYIVNHSNNIQATGHLASNFSASHSSDIIHSNASCQRSEHSEGLDYCKPFSYMISPSSQCPSTPPASMSEISSKRISSELQLNASSTISVAAVTSLTATSASRMYVNSTTASNCEEISYKCRICDKVFGCSQTLQAHEKTHKSPRYECNDCGKGFSQLRNYKYHLSVHRGTKEFAAECPECGKTFNDKGYLSSHMKIHRNKKEYECPYCPKSFNQRVAFNMHVRIHTGVKPHKCAECGKRFSRKMLLKQHLRTHSGEKPYQCSVCGKSFADRSNMTLHHRLHSGIKPFNCPICPKAFTKKHHLKTHLNYHTGCKPYICPHPNCNQAFTQSSNMRTHAKKCQYKLDRPIQFPSFPTVVAATMTSSSSHIIPSSTTISSSTLTGIRMLSSGVSTQQFLTQPLLSTFRSSL